MQIEEYVDGIPQLKVGSKMPNGAIVLAQDGELVLAERSGEYVTWRIDFNGNGYSGSYYRWDVNGSKSQAMVLAANSFYQRVHGKSFVAA